MVDLVQDEHAASPPTLWRHHDFMRLWGAQSVSLFGSQITTLALPLTAISVLHASAWQMGVLGMFGKAPFLIFSLVAGVWLDRVRRLPVLIGADVLRALLLMLIPLAAWLHMLTLLQLYLVTFAVGTLSVVFDVAHFAYVPSLIPREQLVEGNSKLQVSYSVAESGGPGIAGLLAQAVSAPFAVLLDALSFVASAVLLGGMHTPEPPQPTFRNAQSPWSAAAEGMRALLEQPLLRAIIIASVLSELFGSALLSIYVLYVTSDLQLSPALLGVILAVGGAAAVPGALLAARVAAHIGVGRAIVGGWLVEALARLLIPFAAGPATIVMLLAAHTLIGAAGTIANIHQWTLRQHIIPEQLQARATASHRFMVFGASAIGALLGGVLATWLGLHMALLICAAGALLGPLSAIRSPLWALHTQPGA